MFRSFLLLSSTEKINPVLSKFFTVCYRPVSLGAAGRYLMLWTIFLI